MNLWWIYWSWRRWRSLTATIFIRSSQPVELWEAPGPKLWRPSGNQWHFWPDVDIFTQRFYGVSTLYQPGYNFCALLGLTGLDLPGKVLPTPQATESFNWLQELTDLLEEAGPDPTTSPPSRATNSRPRGHSRHKHKKPRVHAVAGSEPGDVRLAGDQQGSSLQGRVELYANGEWGTVCDDLWSVQNALVVCRQLGFRQALKASRNSEFGEGRHLPILLDDVQCKGTESTLLDCQHAAVGTHNCAHYEDAGVVCGN